MTNQTIPPALTADQWMTRKVMYHETDGPDYTEDIDIAIGPSGQSVYVRRNTNGMVEYVGLHGDKIPATIALANHALPDGHPLKITRDDIKALTDAAGPDFGPRIDIGAFQALAAKLAALLPPETD